MITVKLTQGEGYENEQRWRINKFFKEECYKEGLKFNREKFRKGNYMTVGTINYNESNYDVIIRTMENIMDKFIDSVKIEV